MKNKAQSLLEYAVVICIIIAALISMRVYIKRGLQGSLRANADSISSAYYSPGATISRHDTNVVAKTLREQNSNDTEGDIFFGFNQRSNSKFDINMRNNQIEEVLPFRDEPRRF